ncbi:hypothetical protein D3C79_757560 [compost metagenome]
MGDDVSTCCWYIDTDAYTGKADLVAFDHFFGGECRFDGGAISQVDTACCVDNCRVGSEPEGLVRVVGGKADRLGVVEHPGCGVQYTHVRGRAGSAGHPRTDSLGQAQVEHPAVGVLVPSGESTSCRQVRAGVYFKERGLSRRLSQASQDQQSQWVGRWTVHESSLLQSGPWGLGRLHRARQLPYQFFKSLLRRALQGNFVLLEASNGGADDPGLGAIGASLRGKWKQLGYNLRSHLPGVRDGLAITPGFTLRTRSRA